jgi:ParB/RepB/Spo0J family partition protein
MSKHPEIGDSYPVRDIALDSISDRPASRLRKLNDGKVNELAKSMKVSGLINPITVRQVRPQEGNGYEIIAGRHRYLAARKLKLDSIKCFVRKDLSEDDVVLIEIDENLIRADLTAEEKREHLLLRKALWEKRHPEIERQVGQDDPPVRPHGHRQAKSFAAETAAKTGIPKRTINRLLAEPKPKPKPEPNEVWVDENGNPCEPLRSDPNDPYLRLLKAFQRAPLGDRDRVLKARYSRLVSIEAARHACLVALHAWQERPAASRHRGD